jgi:hypothetical protein
MKSQLTTQDSDMLKKYTFYWDNEHGGHMRPHADDGDEFYATEDVDTQLNDLRRAVRVVLSEWKEIEGSKIQSELRKLLADSYRTPSAGEKPPCA